MLVQRAGAGKIEIVYGRPWHRVVRKRGHSFKWREECESNSEGRPLQAKEIIRVTKRRKLFPMAYGWQPRAKEVGGPPRARY